MFCLVVVAIMVPCCINGLSKSVCSAGVTLPLLSQSIILFQLTLSGLVLKKGLEREQVRMRPTAIFCKQALCVIAQHNSL